MYYPHVHFRDDAWLKRAALYWDQLHRFFHNDANSSFPISRAEIELLEDGFIRQISPSADHLEQVAGEFAKIVGNSDGRTGELARQVELSEERRLYDIQVEDMHQAVASWKMSETLASELVGRRLGYRVGDDRISMRRTLAHAYLLLLGMRVSRDVGAHPVADNEFHHAAVGVSPERLLRQMAGDALAQEFPAGFEREVILVNLTIDDIVPRDIAGIPLRDITKFRRKYAGKRAKFRDAVSGILAECAELDDVKDPEALLNHLRIRYDTRVRPAVAELEQAMRRHGWTSTALQAVNVQTVVPPIAATAITQLALHPSAPAAAAIGLGGFSLGVWRSRREGRQKRDELITAAPMAYLHHLRADLARKPLAELVRKSVARLTPDQPISPVK